MYNIYLMHKYNKMQLFQIIRKINLLSTPSFLIPCNSFSPRKVLWKELHLILNSYFNASKFSQILQNLFVL